MHIEGTASKHHSVQVQNFGFLLYYDVNTSPQYIATEIGKLHSEGQQ